MSVTPFDTDVMKTSVRSIYHEERAKSFRRSGPWLPVPQILGYPELASEAGGVLGRVYARNLEAGQTDTMVTDLMLAQSEGPLEAAPYWSAFFSAMDRESDDTTTWCAG